MKISNILIYNSQGYNSKTNSVSKSSINFCATENVVQDSEKLFAIMSKQELEKTYDNISKNLKLDYKPALELVDDYKDGKGGGYTFSKNTVSLCYSDLVCSDYKIIASKNGKKFVLVDFSTSSPLFSTQNMAQEFLNNAKSRNNFGFDSLEMVPTTLEDKKRLIVQKISHELIHAQQHMLMRQTEGIGEKEIIKAWTHYTPKNENEENQLAEYVEKTYKDSYWSDKPKTPIKIQKRSTAGYITYGWLNAVKNYPSVQSKEYLSNAIEVDAYRRSSDYVQNIFGELKP